MKTLLLCFVLLTANGMAFAEKNAGLAFVTEYVRELGATQSIRTLGEQELEKANSSSEKILGGIRYSTRVQLELRTSIALLSSMRLKPPADSMPQALIKVYKQKIELHQQLIDVTSQFLDAPKPGVEYGKLSAEMPKITASLEFEDETLFRATPAIFAALIDTKPDSMGHLSHLVITKAERQKLIRDLKRSFGAKLTAKDQDYTVSGASVLLAYLQRDFKCSDEPW